MPMVNLPRLARPFAAALGLAAALWMLPASALESGEVSGAAVKAGAVVSEPAAAKSGDETPRAANAAKSDAARASGVERPRTVRYGPRRRVAVPYYYRPRIREVFNRECSGFWCGSPYVLLLGIGF